MPDTTPPVVSFTSPANNASFNSDQVTVTGTISDASAIARLEYALNGGTHIGLAAAGGFAFTVSGLVSGNNTITVYATDSSGNMGINTIAVQRATSSSTATLTVNKTGTGAGSVSSAPNGIDCGATCTANFATSSSVTLTAIAANGSSFAGWTGACSGTATCSLSMNGNQSVTARFDGGIVTPSFTLEPMYPQGSANYPVAQGADSLHYLHIQRQNGFATLASSFDGLDVSGSIIGATADKVKVVYSKALSSADQLAFVLAAGSATPPGEYTVSVTARGGGVTSSAVNLKILVTTCSSGC